MTEKFEAKIKSEGDKLSILVKYEVQITARDVELLKDYYQWRLSDIGGKEIPVKEVEINLKEGQIVEETMMFSIEYGKEPHSRINRISEKAPYVLPRLVDELKKYAIAKDANETALVNHAVSELEKIINTK